MTSTMMGAGMFRRPLVSPLQFLMLLQLNKGPKYGYEVLKAFREQFKGVWEPKTGTIYPALRRLEARDFVKTDLIEDKEFYSLTERGEALLKRMGDRLGRDLRFADRYFRFVTEWMPRAMKDRVVEMLSMLAEEDVWPPILIEHFIDGMDGTTKLEVLESMKKRLVNRMKVVEGLIEDLKEGGTS